MFVLMCLKRFIGRDYRCVQITVVDKCSKDEKFYPTPLHKRKIIILFYNMLIPGAIKCVEKWSINKNNKIKM